MTIYIEYVIFDNLVFDAILIVATLLTLKLPVKHLRVFLAAAIGASFALLVPILPFGGVLALAIKLLCLPLMCLVALPYFNIKNFFWAQVLFAAYTFALGGVIFGLYFLGFDFDITKGVITYQESFPLGLYALSLCLFLYGVFCLVRYLKRAKKRRQYLKNISFSLLNTYFEGVGYLDSGNTLCFEQVPVCFVADPETQRRVSKLIAKAVLERQGLLKKVPYKTVSGEAVATAIEVEMHYESRKLRVFLALPKETMKTDYQFILNCEMEKQNENSGIFEKAITTAK